MPEITGRLRTPRLAAAPSSPATGEVYYDTNTNKLYWWNGTIWVDTSGGGGAASVPIEPWRLVGTASQPSFENGWSNWDPAGTGRAAAFRKDPGGQVRLQGIIKSPGTTWNTAFTLPVGYRPAPVNATGPQDSYWNVVSAGAVRYCVVWSDGRVIPGGPSGLAANEWVDLSNISFAAAAQTTFPTGPQGPPGPAGGAANQVAQSYAMMAGYTKDRSLNPAATTVNEVAATLATLIDDMKTAGLIQP